MLVPHSKGWDYKGAYNNGCTPLNITAASQKIRVFRYILNLRSQTVHRPVILSFSHTSLIRVPNWTRTAESYSPALFPPHILLALTDLGIILAFDVSLALSFFSLSQVSKPVSSGFHSYPHTHPHSRSQNRPTHPPPPGYRSRPRSRPHSSTSHFIPFPSFPDVPSVLGLVLIW